MSRIEARPGKGLSYNATEDNYWQRAGLDQEIERAFDICHGCRLCFNLCPSFPALFEALDRTDGDVRKLSAAERARVIDLCYECRMCELRCPYTTRDKHEFQLDFARLMMRAKAVAARESGVKLRGRLLGNPDLLGKVGSIAPGLANFACRNRFQRLMMEKVLGIHRDKKLPEFADETFEKWLARNPLPPDPADPAAKVVLFPTCFVNYYNPGPAKAAIEVMSRNRCALACTRQDCCGMPAIDVGDVAFAQKRARANIESMLPLVRKGYRIAALNPTCSLTMKREYLDILGGEEVKQFAAAVVDPHELLWMLKQQDKFDRDFRTTPGKVAYHLPCHLKFQQIGFRSRDLMRLIPGAEVTMVDACTAHDGTWAMKREFFELSMKWGEKAFAAMRDADAAVMATDCVLSAIQIEQATGTRPLHPIEVLARAYAEGGFPDKVPPRGQS
ncbi:MAG: heterodisulfide reductase-related iron-sulfur binding cluster [Candidatus Binataceae bacterium]